MLKFHTAWIYGTENCAIIYLGKDYFVNHTDGHDLKNNYSETMT